MVSAERSINPYISVDCVIFGFRSNSLKVLLVERDYVDLSRKNRTDFKLPGDFITIEEDLEHAAHRILEELTGLKDIYLKPFGFFGKPGRLSAPIDRSWLFDTTGYKMKRVVTAAYFALINIPRKGDNRVIHPRASWVEMDEIPPLAFDHADIIRQGHEHLQEILRNQPICFELLPEKFTLRQLQNVYESILGCELDNRNFRKKTLKASYLIQLEEKQKGVAHKPAHYYRFDREIYDRSRKNDFGFHF